MFCDQAFEEEYSFYTLAMLVSIDSSTLLVSNGVGSRVSLGVLRMSFHSRYVEEKDSDYIIVAIPLGDILPSSNQI